MELTGENANLFFMGAVLGLSLLLVGTFIGFLMGRRRGGANVAFEGMERTRILDLLRELGKWTTEYRGGVEAYQNELSAITSGGQSASGESLSSGVLPLVEQIMATNKQLQSRLDAAERQLEDQTAKIESYLSEARTDGLTGLPNRRAFDKKLDEVFAKFRTDGDKFTLAMVDIDHFKKFNDTYGHQVGDIVLAHVAQLMQREIEGALIVARFGGEEFAALFDVPLQVAASKMDRFRRKCEAEIVKTDGQELSVTLSIGVSETNSDQAIGPLFRRADEALYAAKGIGRNRVYYHDGLAPTLFGAPEVSSQKRDASKPAGNQ